MPSEARSAPAMLGGRVQAQHVRVAPGRARRRGWSGSRRRRRRTRARRSHRREQPRHGARGLDRLADASPAARPGCRTRRAGRCGGRRRRSAGARRSARRSARCSRRRSSSVPARPRQRAQHRGAQRAPAGCGEPERERRERGAGRERPGAGAPGGLDRGAPGCSRASRACDLDLASRPAAGRRGGSPATSRAATIDPAEVPTKYSQRRRSKPVASSIPASTPIIQASPSTPPPPSTSTSGRERIVAQA